MSDPINLHAAAQRAAAAQGAQIVGTHYTPALPHFGRSATLAVVLRTPRGYTATSYTAQDGTEFGQGYHCTGHDAAALGRATDRWLDTCRRNLQDVQIHDNTYGRTAREDF